MEWSEKRYWRLFLVGTALMFAGLAFSGFWLNILWLYWPIWSVGVVMTLYCYWRAYWMLRANKAERKARR